MNDKLKLPQLAMLEWLCEAPIKDRLYFQSRVFTEFQEVDGEVDGKPVLKRVYPINETSDEQIAFIKRFGGRANIETTELYRTGMIGYHNGLHRYSTGPNAGRMVSEVLEERYHNFKPHFSDNVYFLQPAGRHYFEEEGRARLKAMREDLAQKQEAVSRLVLLGVNAVVNGRVPDGVSQDVQRYLQLPRRRFLRPFALARVVKETGSRLYIDDVEVLPFPGDVTGYRSIIRGSKPNTYVDKEVVILDPATPGQARAWVDVEMRNAEEFWRLTENMARDMIPVISSHLDRLAQKEAEAEDALRDLMNSFSEDKGDDPKP